VVKRFQWDENEGGWCSPDDGEQFAPQEQLVRASDYDVLCAKYRAALEWAVALRELLNDMGEDLAQRHHKDKYRVYQISPQTVLAARKAIGYDMEDENAPTQARLP